MARDLVTVRPERFVAGGEALAHDAEGRVVFVRGGVPGDEVEVEITERKGEWSRGRVVGVIDAAPDRVEPPCPQRRLGCGGCDWQHVAVGAQLPAKVDVVRDAFRRTARMPDAVVSPGRAVPPDAYRTTIRVVGDSDARPAYRFERSHDTVPAGGCLVAHPGLRDLLERIVVPAGVEVALRVSAATGERTALWDHHAGDVTGLPDDVGVGPASRIRETVADRRFQVSAASFFQSGPAAAELLVDAVRRAAPELAEAQAVLDAYAGVGLFAAAATTWPTEVITVESSRAAVADARVNLADRDATIVRSEVGRWRPAADTAPIDAVIGDPARSGLAKPGVAAIAAVAAPFVVLVSCDPVSAARDAALLTAEGYRHDGTEVLDLFPHTHHIECVTRYVRTRGGSRR